MQSHRQYRRYITEYKVMYTGFHRLNGLLIRLSDRLAQINRIPSLDELLVLCRILSPIQCNSNLYIYMSDNFIGGLVLYFWLFSEVHQDNNQEIIEGISSSMSKKIEYNPNLFATKHPKNTFGALFRLFSGYGLSLPRKQPKKCSKSIFWMFGSKHKPVIW